MILTSDLLTLRLLEAVVILLLFPGSQQLIVAAALDLALQGIGVGMTETTKTSSPPPKTRITHYLQCCCTCLLLLGHPKIAECCGPELSFPQWKCRCREEPVSPWVFSWQMNILSWKVSRDFSSPWLDKENLSGSICISYGIFFHANAVAFLKIELPSGTRSIWTLVTLRMAGSCSVGSICSLLFTGNLWNLTCLDLSPCPLTADLQHWNNYFVFMCPVYPQEEGIIRKMGIFVCCWLCLWFGPAWLLLQVSTNFV